MKRENIEKKVFESLEQGIQDKEIKQMINDTIGDGGVDIKELFPEYAAEAEKMVEYKVSQDQDPSNPRVDWDNMSVMACKHRRYNLGDKNGWDEAAELLSSIEGLTDEEQNRVESAIDNKFENSEDLATFVELVEK